MKRTVILIIIFLLFATGITAKKEATPVEACVTQCGCPVQEDEAGEDAIVNESESALVRMIGM